MVYSRTNSLGNDTWSQGDLVSASDLNRIEEGIEDIVAAAVQTDAQTLTDAQKTAARSNIGAAAISISGTKLVITT